MAEHKDWRGTPIVPGAKCIYAGPVGSHSNQLVEGEIVGFTPSGRVNVKVVRRAYSGVWMNDRDVVHVGADRLVIVNDLPPTEVPAHAEKKAEAKKRWEERSND